MFKFIVPTLLALLLTACSQNVSPKPSFGDSNQYSKSELYANCIEDKIDLVIVPNGLSDSASVEYSFSVANNLCKGL